MSIAYNFSKITIGDIYVSLIKFQIPKFLKISSNMHCQLQTYRNILAVLSVQSELLF